VVLELTHQGNLTHPGRVQEKALIKPPSRGLLDKSKRRSRARDKADKASSYKKQEDKKGESSLFNNSGAAEILRPCFENAWIQGAFSLLALSMIQSVELSTRTAIDMIGRPIAGRIRYCLDSWHKITCSKWVLKVVKDGYRLQLSGRRPIVPYRVKNLSTSDDGALVLDVEVQQMLSKGAIQEVQSSETDIVSCFFCETQKTTW